MNSTIDNDSRQTDPIAYIGRHGHNPGGVGKLAALFPRVAEYSNPGLEDESPSGKLSKLDPSDDRYLRGFIQGVRCLTSK
jgi:hypothetical protein